MRKLRGVIRISSFPVAGLLLAACAPFFGEGASRPMSGARIVQPDLRQSIGYYENAVTAINERHYALALEYLQAARNQKPDDVRVLTAFGVVYDKLGRFDLSARYYAQAASLDPNSRIIAADLDYSRRLQGILTPNATPLVADASPQIAGGTTPRSADAEGIAPSIASAPQNVARGYVQPLPRQIATGNSVSIGAKTDAHLTGKPFFLTGRPLSIIDASGRNGADKTVRSYLMGLGWSVAREGGVKAQFQPQTRIVYKESMALAAKALARTLSLPLAVHLSSSNDAEGLQLILGSDISGDIIAGKSFRAPRQLAFAASEQKSRE